MKLACTYVLGGGFRVIGAVAEDGGGTGAAWEGDMTSLAGARTRNSDQTIDSSIFSGAR